MSAVADKHGAFRKLGVEVLSMSVDSVFVHKMWNETELSKMVDGGRAVPMLSDAGGKVGEVYGVYDEDAGVDTRGRFLIDPDGVVQAFEVLTPPVGRNVARRCARSRPSNSSVRRAAPRPRPRGGGLASPRSSRVPPWWDAYGRCGSPERRDEPARTGDRAASTLSGP